MKIIKKTFTWNGKLLKRTSTDYIVLHHRAGNGDVESIHKQHLSQGWTGIGYHFYVRKDGTIYRGRPIEMIGAHCVGYNNTGVSVCFEGNFENEKMSETQKKSGQEIVAYLKELYPKAIVKRHKDLDATSCPGKHFPFDEIKTLQHRGEDKMIYNYIDANMPDWARPTIQKLVNKGYLKGNEKGELGLDDTMLKIFVVNDRAGIYDL